MSARLANREPVTFCGNGFIPSSLSHGRLDIERNFWVIPG